MTCTTSNPSEFRRHHILIRRAEFSVYMSEDTVPDSLADIERLAVSWVDQAIDVVSKPIRDLLLNMPIPSSALRWLIRGCCSRAAPPACGRVSFVL